LYDSDIDSDDYEDEEWEELMEEFKADLRGKLKELSSFIGKALGPRILLSVMSFIGFTFHMAFPYTINHKSPPETDKMRKLLSFFAESQIA